MIAQYGADSVRWFIMSDSPPEKDIQWSNVGVAAANKFLQRVWNLIYSVSKKNKETSDKVQEKEFVKKINTFMYKIDVSISQFKFNVSIALFYELFNYLIKNITSNVSQDVMKKSLVDVMKLMIPFTPHLARESLEFFNCKTTNKWPDIDTRKLSTEINFAIQIMNPALKLNARSAEAQMALRVKLGFRCCS